MSPQRTLAETGRAWISSRVRWCLRFTTLWYQKTISDENKQMKDLTPETSRDCRCAPGARTAGSPSTRAARAHRGRMRTAKCFLPPACSTHLTAEKGRRILSHAKGRPATITVARDVGHSWRRRGLSERSEFRSLQKECPARPRRITSTAGKRHKGGKSWSAPHFPSRSHRREGNEQMKDLTPRNPLTPPGRPA